MINNINININIQQIQSNTSNNNNFKELNQLKSNNRYANKSDEEENNLEVNDNEYYDQSPGKRTINSNFPESPSSISKRWRFLSNVVKSVSSFRRFDTKKLENEEELDQDLNDFKEKYANSIDKKRRNRDSLAAAKSGFMRFSTMKNIFHPEIVKDSLKESIVNIILE